jgi:metal-responsive CopG/Arc/MetJ family transcriptional regulator
MHRTQVQLTEAQVESLKGMAARRDASLAELIREAVDQYLRRERPIDPAARRRRLMALAGKHRSGRTDGGARHDEILAEEWHDWEKR